MRWNLRMAAAQRDVWKASQLQAMLADVGLVISAGKMSHLWSGRPVTIRLEDLQVICSTRGCTPNDLLVLEQQPISRSAATQAPLRAAAGEGPASPEGVLILTDMFGGTPTNLSLPFLSPTVEIVTGVNLPMLIKLTQSREGSLREIARMVRDQGQEAIYVATDLLEKRSP